MAMSVSSSVFVAPLHPSTGAHLSSCASPKLPWPKPAKQQRSFVVIAQKSGNGALTEKKKRELLQGYGLNPDEFLSDTSPKTRRRRKDVQETGRGGKVDAESSPPPRTTHKLLQVLGGTARRKKLLSPKGMDVRPMMEVVKGAAFAMLQVRYPSADYDSLQLKGENYAAGGNPMSLRPGRWLDLYSGTGSVGIEAISRGCSQAHFVEMDPWVVSDVLRPNLEWTGFLESAVIHTIRVEDFLQRADQVVGQYGPFDYISVTPPYMLVDYGVLMDQISKSALIGEDSFIVVEYPLKTDMLNSCGYLVKIADRRFGRTHLAIYGPEWADKKKSS